MLCAVRVVGKRHRAPANMDQHLAVDEAVILLHPPLPLVGVSIVMERERQQNDRLVNGEQHQLPQERWLCGDRPEQSRLRAGRAEAVPIVALAGRPGEVVAGRRVPDDHHDHLSCLRRFYGSSDGRFIGHVARRAEGAGAVDRQWIRLAVRRGARHPSHLKRQNKIA